MNLIDFTDYELGNVNYGGSERKLSIVVPDEAGNKRDYMLKFQKSTPFGKMNNHLSEYIGSHVFEMLGFNAQKTFLGTYRGENVVACRSFLEPGDQFVPFNDVGESTLDHDKDRYQYEYDDIMQMLRDNSKLTQVDETVQGFWRVFIVDALLGNFDRHGANWGFLKRNGLYSLAPVFDNGSCLFPRLTDEDEMLAVMGSDEETEKRVYTFPTSQVRLNGRKSSYYEVISSLRFEQCNLALSAMMERIDLGAVTRFIDSINGVSEVHRSFYRHMISGGYRLILEEPAARLTGGAR